MYNDDYDDLWERPECFKCTDHEIKIENIKNFMTGIVEMAYGTYLFNHQKFEAYLDELCHALDIKMIEGDLQIEQKEPDTLKSYFEVAKNITFNYLRK